MLLQRENLTPGRKVAPSPLPPPRPTLRVEPWHDVLIDEVGYDPRSDYVEAFWLPVLGPSTTWLLRHFTIQLEASPGGVELDVEDTARSLGLGERLNQNSPFARTIKRCVDFEMADWRGAGLLATRLRLPPLPRRHARRLPASLLARYGDAWGTQVVSLLSEQTKDLPRDGTRARGHL